jgi:sugar lactone lactonase YvrE
MIDCVLDIHADLGECPTWSVRDQRLYWIDIGNRAVYRYDPATGENEKRELAGRPGSFALTGDPDRLLVAAEHQILDLTWSTGAATVRADIEPEGDHKRLNDGRCDPAGRFWVGSMDLPSRSDQKAGMLHRFEPDGTHEVVATGVTVSNGLAFSPDSSTMYWADTGRATVWAYDFDLDSGTRTNERVFLDFSGSDLPGKPDGACVDEDGCYWVACVYGWSLLRATPGGAIDRIIELPIERPTMPAFGGPDLDTIYLTSISHEGSVELAPGQPQAGGVFAITPGVKGLPEPVFGG